MSRLLKLSNFFRSFHFYQRGSHASANTLRNTSVEVSLKPGDKLFNYTVTRVVSVKEYDLTAVQLVHKTGAEHLHISRRDSDNVFAVAFKTTPRDSTGVPHILEHVTLCGSEKFPVRDPFFKMYTRSLSTFMNAFTANDWTMYPFSSQNAKDFENLLVVYLDAVFHPRLRHTDFNQEGWRLEHENINDNKSPIVLKGVVYNEMKGVFSDPHQVYSQAAQNLLFPSGTYGVVSGGDPNHIPDLTWKQLKTFHSHHYHPSNSRFFTYGDIPVERHLEMINGAALSKLHHGPVDTSVPLEVRWSSPREAQVLCPVDHLNPDPESDTIVSVNHLLCDITDLQESFDLSILCSLLVDGEKAPFYQSLIESGLGSDYSPGTGYSTQTRDLSFSIGLQRVHKSDASRVVKLIDETIDRVIEEGFEDTRIEAVLHKIELSLKHQAEGFGLNMIISLISAWNHGGDPIRLLQVTKYVEELKQKISLNPGYFQDLVHKYFKSNQHKLILVSNPDPEYLEKNKKLELERLEQMVSTISDAKKEEIYAHGLELAEIQSLPEDSSCLPTLQISDVPKSHERVAVDKVVLGSIGATGSPKHDAKKTKTVLKSSVPVQTCVQPTNGVVYLRLVSDASTLPEKLQPFLPLFCHIVTKMGAGGLDYRQQSERIELKTGGLQAGVLLSDHPSEPGKFQSAVTFSSFSLERNLNDMFQLWSDIFVALSFTDRDRLFTLLSALAAESASNLTSAGHRYAMIRSASTISSSLALKESLEGVSQLNFIKKLVSFVTPASSQGDSTLPYDPEKVDELLEKMKEIANHLLLSSAGHLRASLNAGKEVIDAAVHGLEDFHKELDVFGTKNYQTVASSASGKDPSILNDIIYTSEEHYKPVFLKSHLEFPFQVNYIGKTFLAVPFAHSDHASLRVLSKIFTSKYLHREIREKGGAYGGGSDAGSNAFHFYSYRDPNFTRTLEAFSGSVDWAVDGKFTDQDIDEAKLSVFSVVDKPISPGNQGLRMFLQGISEENFAEFRQRVMESSRNDIKTVAQKYLAGEAKGSVAVIGPKSEVSSDPSSGWSIIKDS